MTAKDKEILDRIHDKHYGPGAKKQRRDRKGEKVAKAIKGQKEAKKAKASAPQAPGAEIKTGVGIDDQAVATQPVTKKASKEGSRAALIAEAQKLGIKYFRILTKEELKQALTLYIKGGTTPEGKTLPEIIEAAQARWKAGWGKGEKHAEVAREEKP